MRESFRLHYPAASSERIVLPAVFAISAMCGIIIDIVRTCMMPRQRSLHIDDVPVLVVEPDLPTPHPVIMLQHGYTASNEARLPVGFSLVQHGYRVVFPDTRPHGERRPADFQGQVATNVRRTFLEAIIGTSQDVRIVLDHFAVEAAGIVGISMVSLIACLTLTQDTHITTAVSLIGSPQLFWTNESPLDPAFEAPVATLNPATHFASFFPCVLRIQHGVVDDVVAITHDQHLFAALTTRYKVTPERLRFMPYRQTGHEVTPMLEAETVHWLQQFLLHA